MHTLCHDGPHRGCLQEKGVVRQEWRRTDKPSSTPLQGTSTQSCAIPTTNPTSQQEGETTPRTLHMPNAGSSQANQIISPRPREISAHHKPPEAFISVSKGASTKRSMSVPAESSAMQPNSFSALNEDHILDVLQDVLQRENSPYLPPHEPDC